MNGNMRKWTQKTCVYAGRTAARVFDWYYAFSNFLERRGVGCPCLFVPTVIVGVLIACVIYYGIEVLIWSSSD
jgi:hypothetical protein